MTEILIIIILFSALIKIVTYKFKCNGVINFVLAFLISFIAFFIIPRVDMDLYRHYYILDSVRYYGISFLKNNSDFSNLPVATLYFYLISVLNNNAFLPFITCFFSYFIFYYVIDDFSKKNNIQRFSYSLAIICILFTFNYVALFSGIRNKFAMILFFLIMYNDIFKNKNKYLCTFGYFLLGFFHPSMFVLFLIRILSYVNKKSSVITISILLLIWPLLQNQIITILNGMASIPIINYIVTKIDVYNKTNMDLITNTSLYTFVYTTRNIVMFLIFCLFNSKVKNKFNTYKKFFLFVFSFVFGSINNYNFYVRFSEFIMIINIFPVMLYFNEKIKGQENKRRILFLILLLVEILLFLIFLSVGQYQML